MHICQHIFIYAITYAYGRVYFVVLPNLGSSVLHGTCLRATEPLCKPRMKTCFIQHLIFHENTMFYPQKKICSVRTVLNNKKETRICTQQTQKQVHAAYALASTNMNSMKTCNFNPAKTIVKMQNACGVRTGLKQKKTDSHPKTTFYRKNKKPLRRTHWPNKKKRLRQYAWDEKTKKTNHKQKKGRGL